MKAHVLKCNTAPLCVMPNGDILCCHKKELTIISNNGAIREGGKLDVVGRTFLGNRYLNRLFRTGVRSAIAINDNNVLLAVANKIVEYDIGQRKATIGYTLPQGIRPLVFTEVENIEGFDDGVYFGGYFGNMSKKPVNIYKRTGVDRWEVVYSFSQGAINHVHNVVADPYRQCLWIFTGDFDEASAIWKVTDNFKKVERMVCNDQKYRGCVVYALPEGLLYATDAPFMDDYIYLLNPETMDIKELFHIHGSCIYGCQWKDKYVFSSTVEGDGRNMSRGEFYFGRKRGAGIKDDYVHMYMGNLQAGFKEIYKEKKDCMPFYTFQFGVFKFPAGVNNLDTLYFQPVATKKNDLDLIAMSL